MCHNHPYGMPISVMKFSNTGKVNVNDEELEKIFNHPEIQDRKVVILSIVGASRGGKSFFLDYCLRFLYAHVSVIIHKKEQNNFILSNLFHSIHP